MLKAKLAGAVFSTLVLLALLTPTANAGIELLSPEDGYFSGGNSAINFSFIYHNDSPTSPNITRCSIQIEDTQESNAVGPFEVPAGIPAGIGIQLPQRSYVWALRCDEEISQVWMFSVTKDSVKYSKRMLHWVDGLPHEWFMPNRILTANSPNWKVWYETTSDKIVVTPAGLFELFLKPPELEPPASGYVLFVLVLAILAWLVYDTKEKLGDKHTTDEHSQDGHKASEHAAVGHEHTPPNSEKAA